MAKGRGSIALISGLSTADWDAPTDKATALGFEFIWLIVGLVQLILILRELSGIPSAVRGPYILLAFVTFSIVVYYLLDVMYRGADSVTFGVASKLTIASSFFYYIHFTFRPVVVLYLLHQRGGVLRVVKADTITPLSTYRWKRILDWALAGLAWSIYIGVWGVNVARLKSYYNSNVGNLLRISQSLGQTGLAFVLLLIISLAVSIVVQFEQAKGTEMGDLVTSHLLKTVLPLFILYGIQSLTFDIFATAGIYNGYTYGFNLANVIAEGGLTVAITGAITITMKIPGVQWTPETAVAEVVPSVPQSQWSQWATPNWSQPVYNTQQQSQFHSARTQQQQYPDSTGPHPTMHPLPITLPDVY